MEDHIKYLTKRTMKVLDYNMMTPDLTRDDLTTLCSEGARGIITGEKRLPDIDSGFLEDAAMLCELVYRNYEAIADSLIDAELAIPYPCKTCNPVSTNRTIS